MVVVGAVAFATLLAGSAIAVPLFPGELNKFAGSVVGTDENVIAAGQLSVAGTALGEMPSLRTVAGSVTGINLPQAFGVVGGGRAAYVNPTNGLAGFWGARSGALARWNTVKDGTETTIPVGGSVTGQAYNLNPSGITAISGAPTFDGSAPGSIVDLAPDFLALTPTGATSGIAIFQVSFYDNIPLALGGFNNDPSGALGLFTGGLAMAEDTKGTFFDLSGAQTLSDNDGDGRVLTETDFNYAGGDVSGALDTEVDDAVDLPTLLLAGRMFATTATFTFVVPNTLDPTTAFLDVSVTGKVLFESGALFGLNKEVVPGTIGTFSADFNGISAASLGTINGGVDPSLGLFDFIGRSASADLSFQVSNIPEPLSVCSVLAALGALGGYARRRYA
jgi:hypothetical protein